MNILYFRLLRPILFLLEPESAHKVTLFLFRFALSVPIFGRMIPRYYTIQSENLEVDKFGLHFDNPVGLAAGFDKDGKYIDLMACLGFGFIEVGTVTPLAQSGNSKPRLFRIKKDFGLINRMGFNNSGVDALANNLKNRKNKNIIIGGNIGKNKNTPNDLAHLDYVICFKKLYALVDYFVINVSSPNTPGLRALQDKSQLDKILSSIQDVNLALEKPKPVFVKISPDISETQLDNILATIQKNHVDGLVATNTTIGRNKLLTNVNKIEKIGNGGLSGLPLQDTTQHWLAVINKKRTPGLYVIGVGGIMSTEDALDHLHAGADLIQLYSGLIYKGPGLVKEILKALASEDSSKNRTN